MFMSPSLGRKNGPKRDDESQLILNSPSSDSEANFIINGNHQPSSSSGTTSLDVGFVFPKAGKLKTPVSQVVQSLKFQASSRNYSELGSCPSLNTGQRPLLARSLGDSSNGAGGVHEEFVQTAKGRILVVRQGDPRKPVIITYHDLGLNYSTNFQTFFNSGAMGSVCDTFCIYHVIAPGQEPGAEDLPEGFCYPTMDELSEQVEYVMHYYGIAHCVCFGVGLGANVLVRLARRRSTMVDGLILINCNSQNAGWVEWVYNKINLKSLRKQQRTGTGSQLPPGVNSNSNSPSTVNQPLPESVVDYLIWYHLGRPDAEGRGIDAISVSSIYKQYFICGGGDGPNGKNLALLMQAYVQRSDLNLAREIAANGKELLGASVRALKTPVLNMTGDHSPHVDATVAFNGRLQPNKCTWMKIQDSAMILEEQPAKVAEAVKLFLQGLGYTTVRGAKIRSVSLANTPVKKLQNKQNQQNQQDENVNQPQTAELITGLQELVLINKNQNQQQ